MSYLRYLCLVGIRGVEHILCCVFCNIFPHHGYVASFFCDYPFGIL